jgi:hypothetical protein
VSKIIVGPAQLLTSRLGNRYKIYPQPDMPGCDCFFWMLLWLTLLERVHYNGKLEPDDFVFPAISSNGVVHRGEHISHDAVQAWINEATTGAGIPRGAGDSFTTHTYRRGGAQWRWMFAPVGERWTMARVRWWGSWAENENVSVRTSSNTSRLTSEKQISVIHSLGTSLTSSRLTRMTTVMPCVPHRTRLMVPCLVSTGLSSLCAHRIYSTCGSSSQLTLPICGVTYAPSQMWLSPARTDSAALLPCARHWCSTHTMGTCDEVTSPQHPSHPSRNKRSLHQYSPSILLRVAPALVHSPRRAWTSQTFLCGVLMGAMLPRRTPGSTSSGTGQKPILDAACMWPSETGQPNGSEGRTKPSSARSTTSVL